MPRKYFHKAAPRTCKAKETNLKGVASSLRNEMEYSSSHETMNSAISLSIESNPPSRSEIMISTTRSTLLRVVVCCCHFPCSNAILIPNHSQSFSSGEKVPTLHTHPPPHPNHNNNNSDPTHCIADDIRYSVHAWLGQRVFHRIHPFHTDTRCQQTRPDPTPKIFSKFAPIATQHMNPC